ncbi:abnormal spindle-like microcephaly-associated protein [Brachionichthys hirsutus]|uniref:abnormal spindle-like microcephaly-associated protein n=1 Tax=Brachionichthys hirsutus TaxID=412623 RepID=UPI00360507FC
MSEPLTSTQRGFLDFSPVRKDDGNKENNLPILSLIQFSRAPFVTFGTAKLGTSKSRVLRIENPTEDAEVEVTVEKIPSSKGFSVDHKAFTIQPDGSFSLTVTWSPAEEGGVRELIIFNANGGAVKHQAVLLGRAEAPTKKKKKILWDKIKNKREAGKRRTKTDRPLKTASNKTFQVGRKSQDRREKPGNPLSSVNERNVFNPAQSQRPLTSADRGNLPHTEKLLPIQSGKLMDGGGVSDRLMSKPRKVANTTLSPIGTPPRVYSEGPLPVPAGRVSRGIPVPSLEGALALIDSDLQGSPRDSGSSCGFSDSLESKSGNDARALPGSPQGSEPGEARLTFFVSRRVAASGADETGRVKKAPFSSATVTKAEAPQAANGLSGRKIKKSRRRLLDKTLESESGPDSPQLPVIDAGILERQGSSCDDRHRTPDFPVTPPLPMAPFLFSPSPAVGAAAVFTSPSPSPQSSSSPLAPKSNPSISELRPTASAPPYVQEDSFPDHLAANSKKRKSEEYLKRDGNTEDAGKPKCVKRSRAAASRSVQERSAPQRRAGSLRSTATPSLKKKTAPAVPARANQPRSNPPSRGGRPSRSTGASSTETVKVAAVAQSRLTFLKPAQTAIPRHPMPFAAKNMFYDERWAEKQERGFTWWINYVLTPDDFKVNTEVAKGNAVSIAMGNNKFSVPEAPTKEEMSFSTYTARRKLNRLRRAACQLFTSEAMVKAIQRLELEVEAKRLLVRKDRHLWRDIGERKKVLNWLLSYNPLWLRIGLETVFGELISLESNSDALGLAVFILQRLLWNPDIAAEFRHARVPHLYKDGHEEALSRFTLKKLLLLVCFLDKAKESRLIEHNPCLFCPEAEFKTTKDLLLAFSRDFLSGEGILSRHLGYLGLPVSHVQRPLDEFDFAVKNLAVDLRCGVRLVRVMELLVQDWTLLAKLRLPAISRLQKVHNVDLALQVLKSKGVDLKDEHGAAIDSRDVVDGHREKTLSLLWKIIFAFQVEVILDEDQLREEIGFLKTTLRTKRRLAALKADQGLQAGPVKRRTPYEHGSVKAALLMDWVRAVGDFYNLKAENFTVAFSDGRVLCHLIHHYHPSLLPGGAVSHSTTQTVECSPRGRLELSCSASDSDGSFESAPVGTNGPRSPSVEFKELLENERSNFRLVNTAVSFLGGVPAMINPADMSNTIPNEKVVMSYLSFLCARLLDLRNETRAARAIQGAWRKYKLKKDLQLYQERNSAAVKIQLVARTFLRRRRAERENRAAIITQSVWRGHATRKRLRLERRARLRALQHEAAAAIQAQWRMISARRAYQRLKSSVVVVQAQWRMRRAASAYTRIYRAATVIQKHARARAAAREERQHYLALRNAAVQMQRRYRGWKTQKTERESRAARVIQAAFKKRYEETLAKRRAAAVAIQSWYRMQRRLSEYRRVRRSAVLIQARCRGHAQRRRLQTLQLQRRSAVVIQSAFRGHAARRQVAQLRRAAVVIQRAFRASVERSAFVRLRRAAIAVQAAYRGKASRGSLKTQRKAATAIQAAFRKHAARKRYLLLQRAAGVLQLKFRATMLARATKEDYNALRRAALTVQAGVRGMRARTAQRERRRAATLIQSAVRMFLCRKKYLLLQSAAVVIQSRFRAHVARRAELNEYRRLKRAVLKLQAVYRGSRARGELQERHRAAAAIQAQFRMHRIHEAYRATKRAAVIIQGRYRAKRLRDEERQRYRAIRSAAVVIQAAHRGRRARREMAAMQRAAGLLQRTFRSNQDRKRFLAIRAAALVCQRRRRAATLARKERLGYLSKRRAVIRLQAAYRGRRVRAELVLWNRAATVIQSAFRRHREEVKFKATRSSAVILQRSYRSRLLQRRARETFLQTRRSAIVLQAAARGWFVRRDIRCQSQAATVIQSFWKCSAQRQSFQRKREAAVRLQRCVRAALLRRAERSNAARRRGAAITLQTRCRAWLARRQVREAAQAERRLRFASAAFHHVCAIKIQRALRAHWALESARRQIRCVLAVQRWVRARQQRRRYLEDRRKVLLAQRAVKHWLACRHKAAAVIQSAVRKFILLRRQKRVERGILKAQALWRGHRSRRLHDNPKAVTLRRRLRKVSAVVQEEDKLCNKTASGLEYLLRYKHFSHILGALKNLDTATRLSPECCERLGGSGATDVLFRLIRCCNRSVPCMDIITSSIQILLNLSKGAVNQSKGSSFENRFRGCSFGG